MVEHLLCWIFTVRNNVVICVLHFERFFLKYFWICHRKGVIKERNLILLSLYYVSSTTLDSLYMSWGSQLIPNLCLPLRLRYVSQRLKRLPPMRETWVRSLGWEDPLEKEMATHSSILAWRSPWMEEPGRLQSTGSQRVGHDWATSSHLTEMEVCV